ncbi:MAG: type II toxin-antitoxin system RelE/ParE family toxin [Pseudonocardiaceae bacterium]
MADRIELTPEAIKDLEKLDRQVAVRIQRFLRDCGASSEDPRALGTQLVGKPFWRYRVGDYRILAEIDDSVLLVLVIEVGHRRQVYRRR